MTPPRDTPTSVEQILSELRGIREQAGRLESALVVLIDLQTDGNNNIAGIASNITGYDRQGREARAQQTEDIIDAIGAAKGDLARGLPPVAPQATPMRDGSGAGRLPTGHVVEVKSERETPRGDITGEMVVNGIQVHYNSVITTQSIAEKLKWFWVKVRPAVVAIITYVVVHFGGPKAALIWKALNP